MKNVPLTTSLVDFAISPSKKKNALLSRENQGRHLTNFLTNLDPQSPQPSHLLLIELLLEREPPGCEPLPLSSDLPGLELFRPADVLDGLELDKAVICRVGAVELEGRCEGNRRVGDDSY